MIRRIHCIGNSHAQVFSGQKTMIPEWPTLHNLDQYPFFKTYRLGPTIAYNFYEHHFPKVLEILETIQIDKETEAVLLCSSEVDCRWHLPRQIQLQNDKKDHQIVAECVERYFRSFIHLKDLGYKVFAFGTHPTTTSGHCDTGDVVFGNVEYRNRICRLFNTFLWSNCQIHGINFISIYEQLVDENNITKMEYLMDYCHLKSEKCMPLILNAFAKLGYILR